MDDGCCQIRDYLAQADTGVITELAVDYVRTFIGGGNNGYSAAYPFESVYTSPKRLLMQGARDEVLAIYRAAGLEKSESWGDGEDYIALELEFMEVLGKRALEAVKAGNEEGAVDVVCLGYLERELLVEMAAHGMDGVVLASGPCERCALEPGGTLPQAVPERRTRPFNSLRRLADDADLMPCDVGVPWGGVEIDRGLCSGCRTCAVFCPTGALRMAGGRGEPWGLEHVGALCVRCGACASICPHGALTLADGAPIDEFLQGARTFIELDAPDWVPNRPDSMFKKWSKLLGGSNMAEY